jgi:MFS family permease
MSGTRGLRHLLVGQRFRQLFAVRLSSQFGDGIFQAALASYVLFSPERQPDSGAIAVALAAVLLPFSVLGPFVGVFLDRWNRRQILAFGNLARTVPVAATAAVISSGAHDELLAALVIAALGVNRFLLAGLSAALPRVVSANDLVLANSVTPTGGTVAFLLGLGAATGVRHVPGPVGTDSSIVLLAAVVYCAAAALATRMPVTLLGPDAAIDHPAIRQEVRAVLVGLVGGLRHLQRRSRAAAALAVIAGHRFFYGLSTVATILLYRNYFNEPVDTEAGLAGLSLAVGVSGVGFFLAAVVTPYTARRWGASSWSLVLLGSAALASAYPSLMFSEWSILVAALVLGLASQGVKICVDTLVQTSVDDAFRGRVFSIYDVVFNVVFVAAAAVAVLVVPPDGRSSGLLAGISVRYAATAASYAVWARRPTPALT